MTASVTIRPYIELAERPEIQHAIDAIFFEASSVKTFASRRQREKFRERWLGTYLALHPQHAYVAVDDSSAVVGYLVGALDRPSPDTNAFAEFEDLLAQYPAHLHVNVALNFRNDGIGGRLVGAFIADAAIAGVSGAHVVTAAQSNNVRFYERQGFAEAARLPGSKPLVFLARSLVNRSAVR